MALNDYEGLFPTLFPESTDLIKPRQRVTGNEKILPITHVSGQLGPDSLMRVINGRMLNILQSEPDLFQNDPMQRRLLSSIFGIQEPAKPVSSSPTTNLAAFQEMYNKIKELTPEPQYLMVGPNVFDQILAKTGGFVTRQYQIGPRTWVKVIDQYLKAMVNTIFEIDNGICKVSQDFFNQFLTSGVYDPETESFDQKAILE